MKKTEAKTETKTEKKQPISLIGRGKLIRETAGREGITFEEFRDVVKEAYPIGGDAWFQRQFKKALARIAKKTAQKPASAPAPVAPAPEKTKKTKKAAAKA